MALCTWCLNADCGGWTINPTAYTHVSFTAKWFNILGSLACCVIVFEMQSDSPQFRISVYANCQHILCFNPNVAQLMALVDKNPISKCNMFDSKPCNASVEHRSSSSRVHNIMIRQCLCEQQPPCSADHIVHATTAWCLHKAEHTKLKLNNGKATTKYVVLEACGLIDLQYVNQ